MRLYMCHSVPTHLHYKKKTILLLLNSNNIKYCTFYFISTPHMPYTNAHMTLIICGSDMHQKLNNKFMRHK